MLKIITTSDGSNSIYNENNKESYHSVNGAIQESQHVFINSGLRQIKLNEISIFEVGFGTGLNALLSYIYAENNSIKILYDTIELFPLENIIYNQLNYSDCLGQNYKQIFLKLHHADWNIVTDISEHFEFNKIHADLRDYNFAKKYNLIYFDAFSPQVEPELWSNEIFSKIYSNMHNDGILVTYCAKGEVRRCLKNIGFSVERITGATGKREMLRAIKAPYPKPQVPNPKT